MTSRAKAIYANLFQSSGEGASLLKTYAGQNTGPVSRPEFLAIILTIWLTTLCLHISDASQLCMDIYVFGVYTLGMWCLFLRPDSQHRTHRLWFLSTSVFIFLALLANVFYVSLMPLPSEPLYYHLAAFSSLDGPAMMFTAFLLAFRLKTRTLVTLAIPHALLFVLLATSPVTNFIINNPDMIYGFSLARALINVGAMLFVLVTALRFAALWYQKRLNAKVPAL